MSATEVVLILQIGSLGDTVVSMPCYREIARRHPDAHRYLLTNYPMGTKMVPAEAILRPTGVIDGCIEYPMPLRKIGKMIELWGKITALKPNVLYYLLPEKQTVNLLRHYAFFTLCGIRHIRAMPWQRDQRFSREVAAGVLWESEASRLLRNLDAPGPPTEADRDLTLTDAERSKADSVLGAWGNHARFIAISVGGKVPLNNWGDENWTAMLANLSSSQPSLGAVFVGSDDEKMRNDALAAKWIGPSLNTCGQLSPRETAAVIARADAFVGHDTGTLHLAAAVNTPVVGVYSARNKPGKWYSDRARDIFFYHSVHCAGCELVQIDECRNGRICITSHDPTAVAAAVRRQVASKNERHEGH